jgi:hypothetical protein
MRIKNNLYMINANGSVNTIISVNNKNKSLIIYKLNNLNLKDEDYDLIYKYMDSGNIKILDYYKIFKKIKYIKLFKGDDDYFKKNKNSDGNSFLCLLSNNKYMMITDRIYTFNTINNEKIIHYYGVLGNSDVVYPCALSNNHIYYLLTNPDLPNTLIDKKKMGSLSLSLFKDFKFNGNLTFKDHSYDKLWAINNFTGHEKLINKLKPLSKVTEIKYNNKLNVKNTIKNKTIKNKTIKNKTIKKNNLKTKTKY